jgi:hypothetical protein
MSHNPTRRCRFAARLKAARIAANLSEVEAGLLLAASGVMCNRTTILAWEGAAGPEFIEPMASDLPIVAAVYGCAVESLYGECPQERTPAPERLPAN